jgi:alpha-L-fucosidase 2
MLLQSHAGELNFLPALPASWPEGEVCGLRARGGFEVDLAWNAGRLGQVAILGPAGAEIPIRYGDARKSVTLPVSGRIILDGDLVLKEQPAP